jgi:hypothetical protein
MDRLDRVARSLALRADRRMDRRQALRVIGGGIGASVALAGLRPGTASADDPCSSNNCSSAHPPLTCCSGRPVTGNYVCYDPATAQCCQSTEDAFACPSTTTCCGVNVYDLDGVLFWYPDCCDADSVCVDPGGCCNKADMCGGVCCANQAGYPNHSCVGGVCCSQDATCGDKCCPAGQKCCLNETGKATCCPTDSSCMPDGTCCPTQGHSICPVTADDSMLVCCAGTDCIGPSDRGPGRCCAPGEKAVHELVINGTGLGPDVCCPPQRLVTATGAPTCCPAGYVTQPGGGLSTEGGLCCPNNSVCGEHCCISTPQTPKKCVSGECYFDIAKIFDAHGNEVDAKVDCASCKGTATLQTAPSGSKARDARAFRPTVLGTAHFHTGKHGGKVKIRLSRRGAAKLKTAGHMRVQLAVNFIDHAGKRQKGETQPTVLNYTRG